MNAFFNKIFSGLKKTSQQIQSSWSSLLNKGSDKKLLEQLEELFYLADFGPKVTQELLREVQNRRNFKGDLNAVKQLVTELLGEVLKESEGKLELYLSALQVILLLGINGSGKTTATAKLGILLKNQKQEVLLGACDTFRAAANEQLRQWAQRFDLPLIQSQSGADAASVAYDAYVSATKKACDFLLLDTAGRLHTKAPLMEELGKMIRVLKKQNEQMILHRWLVIDASLGSNSVEQAKLFHQKVGLTGLVITKLDGTSRGGALMAIYKELKLPIYFIGVGEQAEDLLPFSAKNYIEALLKE